MYVISFKVKKRTKYLAYDRASGGYPYWTNSFSQANIFKTKEDAEEALQTSSFTSEQTFSDGEKRPPTMISSGLELNNFQVKNSGVLRIEEVHLSKVYSKEYTGEIKLPKEIVYKY